jgi:hypothetical protein
MMAGYEDYSKMLGYGPSEKQLRARAEAGITAKDLRFDGEDNEWYGTVYLKDGQPIRIAFYVWKATDEKIHESLSDDLGAPVRLNNRSGGNGHYTADIVFSTSTELER